MWGLVQRIWYSIVCYNLYKKGKEDFLWLLVKRSYQNCAPTTAWRGKAAKKCFVTRTAVTKWEASAGYPSIERLKLPSSTFMWLSTSLFRRRHKKSFGGKNRPTLYWGAAACFAAATALATAYYFTRLPHLVYFQSFCGRFYAFGLFCQAEMQKGCSKKNTVVI